MFLLTTVLRKRILPDFKAAQNKYVNVNQTSAEFILVFLLTTVLRKRILPDFKAANEC